MIRIGSQLRNSMIDKGETPFQRSNDVFARVKNQKKADTVLWRQVKSVYI